MKYYKKIGSDTYHWNKSCSHVPFNVETNPDWKVYDYEPSGEKCNECKSKDK